MEASTSAAPAEQPQQQDAAAQAADADPAADAAGPGGGVDVRCFSETTPSDGRLDFQVIDVGRQVYVWVAAGGARFGELVFSIASPQQGGAPATAVLLRGNAGASGEGLAQRLAMRLKRPVLCSCNIPPDNALLQVVAERRLLRELLAGGEAAAGGQAAAAVAGGGAAAGDRAAAASNGPLANGA